jgi:putative ABC transport system permease protein
VPRRPHPLFRLPWRTRNQVLDDVESELRFHLEMRAQELIARGMSADRARREAERQFGDVEFTRQYMRRMDMGHESEQRRAEWLHELAHDTRYAMRTLMRSRAFTLVAIATLALGIGANTAIFSVVNGILLRPLPFPNPEQLVRIWSVNGESGNREAPVSPLDLDDWRAQRAVLADIGGWFYQQNGSGIDLTGEGEPQRLEAAFVTPGFYGTMAVAPIAGRVPRDDEMVRGADDRLVVLSYGFWQREYGAARSAIGRKMLLGGDPYVIVGVMPPSFRFPSERVEVFIPYSTIPDNAIPRVRPVRILDVVGRLKPGISIERARSEMDGITRRLAAEYREDKNWEGATIKPLHEAIVGNVRTALLVLLAAVAFVLLMACVNVASLMLARAGTRQQEISIRAALGAGRGRIVRQLLTESIVLALAGGLLGLIVAFFGTRLLLVLSRGQLPLAFEVSIDGRVLLFSLAISLLTGVLFGLVPAFRASAHALHQTLREGGRGLASGASQRLRNGLVIGEIALAVVLVVGAGLMARSFTRLLEVDPGFRPERLLVVNFTISTNRHAHYAQFYREVLDKVRALPGVLSAGAAKDVPIRGTGERYDFLPPGYVLRAGQDAPTAQTIHISDGYFKTIGTPIIAGRDFLPREAADTPWVVIVNQAFVKQFLPSGSPVGQVLRFGEQLRGEIVGVVGDIRQTAIDEPAKPTIYIDNMQNSRVRVNLVVRTAEAPLAMTRRVEDTIWSLDRDQTITSVFTFDDIMNEAVARPRLLTVLLGVFGALGLLLGSLGIYGVLAYLVSQRRREIGVRMALGAQQSDVLRLVVWRGLALALGGIVIGLIGAVALTRLMQGVLYGIEPTDPLTFGLVSLGLLAVAVLASWLPARRAASVDPAVAIRYD